MTAILVTAILVTAILVLPGATEHRGSVVSTAMCITLNVLPEEAQKAAAKEDTRKAAAEEETRKAVAEEETRKAVAEEETRKAAEQEEARKAAEEEAQKAAQEARKAAEEEELARQAAAAKATAAEAAAAEAVAAEVAAAEAAAAEAAAAEAAAAEAAAVASVAVEEEERQLHKAYERKVAELDVVDLPESENTTTSPKTGNKKAHPMQHVLLCIHTACPPLHSCSMSSFASIQHVLRSMVLTPPCWHSAMLLCSAIFSGIDWKTQNRQNKIEVHGWVHGCMVVCVVSTHGCMVVCCLRPVHAWWCAV